MATVPAKTPKTCRERSKKYREANREKTRETARAWYHRNREKVLEKKAEEKRKAEQNALLVERQREELESLRSLLIEAKMCTTPE
ncbi:hypothetical protein MarSH_148 [Marseillevirus Shanghai 1]|nr:hypothetical protein MarSH_148 [Marseillevirus Shanghai 1]